MPRVDIREGQLTLPDELREAVHLGRDDHVEAEVVEKGILLRPSPEARRRAALAKFRDLQHPVRYLGPEPRPDATDEEEQLAEILAADRAERRARG